MKEVDQESWDPSIKALTQFPSVLDNMAKNLAWTSQLGEVYHNQAKDVMEAVQTLRAKAEAAGNLKTNEQIKVVQQSPSTIVIEPANPQIVYVPQYNPTVIYGTTYVVPNYTAADVAAASVISFGAGIAVGAMMSGGCCSWGWSSWSCGWHGGTVVYGGHAYYGNAAWRWCLRRLRISRVRWLRCCFLSRGIRFSGGLSRVQRKRQLSHWGRLSERVGRWNSSHNLRGLRSRAHPWKPIQQRYRTSLPLRSQPNRCRWHGLPRHDKYRATLRGWHNRKRTTLRGLDQWLGTRQWLVFAGSE